MSIPDKDFLPWIKLSNERLEKELQAQQEFIPANKAVYPLNLNIRKIEKGKTNEPIRTFKKFIPGKVFFPLSIDSSLTKSQQAVCLKVLEMYRSERDLSNLTKIEQENLEVYKSLQSTIQEEHVKFSDYVKKDWQKKYHRLQNMQSHLFNYIKALWEKKLQAVLSYPFFYKFHDTVCLAYQDPDNTIQVSLEQNVFNTGTQRTALFPTLTSQCIINSANLPTIENYALNVPCSVSQDQHIVNVLNTHDVDIVLSMSATKRLMDDSTSYPFWNIPVIVKQYKQTLPNGDEKLKKVAFIEKILPMQHPTKFEFNEKCHKQLIRWDFCKIFKTSDETMDNSSDNNENAQNIVYNIWNIAFKDKENVLMKTKKQNRKIKFLLRQKIDGYHNVSEDNKNPKQPVIFVPKVEYQLEHGAAISTKSELIRQWADLFFRPYSHLYRVRLQGSNSEVVDVEGVSLQKINTEAMQHYQYKPTERLGTLFTVFSKLLELECGNYMLHHNERTDAFMEILKECPDADQDIKLDLSKSYKFSNCSVKVIRNRPWCPINVNYILPAHSTFKRMPGMFKPLIITYKKKKKGVKNKKKQKKKK